MCTKDVKLGLSKLGCGWAVKASAKPLSKVGRFPQVLEDSRTVLSAADVLPDGPFPQDEKLKDGMVFLISPSPPHHLDLL